MEIKILGSSCAVSEYYLELVEKIVSELNLDAIVTRIDDEAVVNSYGVIVNCLFGYCPGCHSNNLDNDEMNVPALALDGKVIFHSVVPPKAELIEVLKKAGT